MQWEHALLNYGRRFSWVIRSVYIFGQNHRQHCKTRQSYEDVKEKEDAGNETELGETADEKNPRR